MMKKKTLKDFAWQMSCINYFRFISRGIDVQQVSIVINFDIPKNEHVTHRIGNLEGGVEKVLLSTFKLSVMPQDLKIWIYYCTEIEEMPANYTEHLGLN